VDSRHRQQKIDLSSYNIQVPRKFIVCVQFLFIPENERSYSTEEHKVYGPPVAFGEGNEATGYWWLTNNREWHRSFSKEQLAMEVKLKF
jgi:hypothetical protein